MFESRKYEELANEVLEIIAKVGRKRVPPGMIGFAGELFVLSKMYADENIRSVIEYFGGRKAYDMKVGEKKILVKTTLYGDTEKLEYGVD